MRASPRASRTRPGSANWYMRITACASSGMTGSGARLSAMDCQNSAALAMMPACTASSACRSITSILLPPTITPMYARRRPDTSIWCWTWISMCGGASMNPSSMVQPSRNVRKSTVLISRMASSSESLANPGASGAACTRQSNDAPMRCSGRRTYSFISRPHQSMSSRMPCATVASSRRPQRIRSFSVRRTIAPEFFSCHSSNRVLYGDRPNSAATSVLVRSCVRRSSQCCSDSGAMVIRFMVISLCAPRPCVALDAILDGRFSAVKPKRNTCCGHRIVRGMVRPCAMMWGRAGASRRCAAGK